MASIARKNLFEDIPRLLIAQAGIMFAVTLVTIQTGILNGFIRSTTQLIEQSRADLWIASDKMVHFELTDRMPLSHLSKVRNVDGIRRVEPLVFGSARWRPEAGGETSPLRIFGFNPDGQLFVPGQVTQGDIAALKEPYTLLMDETNLKALGVDGIGSRGQIRSLPVDVVGLTKGTQSIASSKFVFASLETANAYLTSGVTTKLNCRLGTDESFECTNVYEIEDKDDEDSGIKDPEPLISSDPIVYLLVQVKPGQRETVRQELEAALADTQVLTSDEMAEKTHNYWQRSTGIGFILGIGAVVGIIVGMVIVSQILYSSVSDHIREFGTLKAMGVSNRTIYSIILEQAMWMSVLGYLPGMALCIGVGIWTSALQGVVILITPVTAAGVFVLTIGMCSASAIFAIQKVTRVDPAIVFKA